MISYYFDKLLTMPSKIKVIVFIVLLSILIVTFNTVEFTHPELPLIKHKGLFSSGISATVLFLGWVLAFAFSFKYLLMDSKTNQWKKIAIENFFTFVFCMGIAVWISIIALAFLITGKCCLLFNSACLN